MSAAPYYQDDFVTLYHGDALELLPVVSATDLVLTDPPYLNLVGGARRSFDGVAKSNGPSRAVGNLWAANLEWVRLLPAHLGAVVFCSHASVCEIASAFGSHRRAALLTWWKRNAAPTGKNVPRFRSEFAWCLANGTGIKWDGLDDTVFDIPFPSGCFAPPERTEHPTQKPEALMTRIIAALDPHSVLDPFAGSGTTLVAAKALNRSAVGIEISERWCEAAATRLSQNVLNLGGAA